MRNKITILEISVDTQVFPSAWCDITSAMIQTASSQLTPNNQSGFTLSSLLRDWFVTAYKVHRVNLQIISAWSVVLSV
jgi:hypothetical protein